MPTDSPATVSRASTRTVLRLGEVEAPIGLFKITTDPKQRKWDNPPEEGDAAAKGSPLTGRSSGGASSGRRPAGSGSASAPPPPKPKGITKGDGAFVDLTEQIKQIAEATTLDCLEVVSFIDHRHVPRERIVGGYYVGAGEGGGGFSPSRVIGLLYRALKLRDRAAVVRWGKRTRSSVGVMIAHRSGALLVLEMAYAEHILAPNASCLAHQHLEFPEEQVEHAASLVDAMAGRRDSLDDIRDRRAEMEEQLVERALLGEEDAFSPAHAVADEETRSLGDILEESIKQAETAKS